MNSQIDLSTIKQIIEVEDSHNAQPYLEKGWILIGVANGTGHDNEPYFKYSLGNTTPEAKSNQKGSIEIF